MMLSRRAMFGVTAAALALPHVAAAQTLTTLAVAGVPEDSITPVLYGVQSGLYKRNGLDVQVTPERSGPAITAGVAGGAYQIGKSSITPLIQAHAKGLPLVIIAPAGVYTSAAPIDGMFVRADSPIKTAADLNGKTFGVYASATSTRSQRERGWRKTAAIRPRSNSSSCRSARWSKQSQPAASTPVR
jgi:NitT/TauT family transport system substrate-binding protein